MNYKGMREMPTNLADFVSSHPLIGGVLMAILTAVLRVVYDKEETRLTRILLEALLCGALTVAGGSAIEAMGFGRGWYLFIGGTFGFMGSQWIRIFAKRLFDRKAGL